MINLKEFNERIKISLSPKLRKLGFKGSNGNYRRIENGTLNCIVVQKSQYGEKFTVEIGVHFDFMPNSLNVYKPNNKFTVYDCEFRKRLSSKLPDLWWEYGENLNEADKTLEEVFMLICQEGEQYFDQFREFPKIFDEIDLSSFNNIKEQLGVSTETRFALVLARIFTHIRDFDKADKYLDFGIEKCKDKPILREVFSNLHDTRKI